MIFPRRLLPLKPVRSLGCPLRCLSMGSLVAEDFPAEHLPANHEWFAHLDFETTYSGPLKPIIDGLAQQAQVSQHLAAVEAFTGFNLQRDLRAVTLSGPAGDSLDGESRIEAGVLMVTGDYDPERLELAMRAIPNLQTGDIGEHTFYRFPDGKSTPESSLYACWMKNASSSPPDRPTSKCSPMSMKVARLIWPPRAPLIKSS